MRSGGSARYVVSCLTGCSSSDGGSYGRCWLSTSITTTATVRTAPWGRRRRLGRMTQQSWCRLEGSCDEIGWVGGSISTPRPPEVAGYLHPHARRPLGEETAMLTRSPENCLPMPIASSGHRPACSHRTSLG